MRIFSAQVTHTPRNVTRNLWLTIHEGNKHVGRCDSIKKRGMKEFISIAQLNKRLPDVKRLDRNKKQTAVTNMTRQRML